MKEGSRHRGAGWEAIRSHLGRTCPWHEGNGYPSSHASPISVTERGCLSGFSVRFLTRQDCHLCGEALRILEKETTRLGLSMIEVDVDEDATLRERYGTRIPVVLGPGDIVLAEGRIARRNLRRALLKV